MYGVVDLEHSYCTMDFLLLLYEPDLLFSMNLHVWCRCQRPGNGWRLADQGKSHVKWLDHTWVTAKQEHMKMRQVWISSLESGPSRAHSLHDQLTSQLFRSLFATTKISPMDLPLLRCTDTQHLLSSISITGRTQRDNPPCNTRLVSQRKGEAYETRNYKTWLADSKLNQD